MANIRAFVGHSFNSEDAPTVEAYLKYFTQLSQSGIDFVWDHAEKAEPKEVAEKVLALLQDKNVFIGICTRKEAVLSQSSIKKSFWHPSRISLSINSIEWKTSDWIIQEIGLARGRYMKMILLMERGVRRPGGLEGNVEYITFDRATPEKSFGKILEMINALSGNLSPLVSAPQLSLAAIAQSDLPQTTEQAPQHDDDWIPKPTWDRFMYEYALFRAIKLGEHDRAELTYATYLKTPESNEEENVKSWEAYREFTKIRLGKGGSVSHLSSLAEANTSNERILYYFARVAERYKDFNQAAQRFLAAARVSGGNAKLDLIKNAALNYIREGSSNKIAVLLEDMRAVVANESAGELFFLRSVIEIHQAEKQNNLVIGAQERIVQLEPSDIDTRFALAFGHSEGNRHELSLLHYLLIPASERKTGAWNNIGVEFARNLLPIKSTEAYRAAEKDGETFAMSNLANKLLKVGFLPEAKEILLKAQAIPDHEKTVDEALAR